MATNCTEGDRRTNRVHDLAAFDRLPPFARELLRSAPVPVSAEDTLALVQELEVDGYTDEEIRVEIDIAFGALLSRVSSAVRVG